MGSRPGAGQNGSTGSEHSGGCCGGGAPATKELYPSLMDLPILSPEKKSEVETLALRRTDAGLGLLSAGLEKLKAAEASRDSKAMQEAVAEIRDGAAQYESGKAAQHLLAEGVPPRHVALQWFMREMNLMHPEAALLHRAGFHYFVIAILAAFAMVMMWVSISRMRRANALFEHLRSAQEENPGAS